MYIVISRLCAFLIALVLALPADAQKMQETILPLDGAWTEDGTVLTLSWQDAKPLRVGPVDINRRPLGATGGRSWEPLVQGLQRRFFYEDPTPLARTAYEYQVIRRARDIVDVGYWLAGWDVPAVEARGIALLVVEDTLDTALRARIDRFARDLVGDGWRVKRHIAPRHDVDNVTNIANGRALRAWITAEAERERGTPHSLILLGHVPVMFSGRVAPDGHEYLPHATDLFYADIGRRWPDGKEGTLGPNTLPDAKIDMSVGRIDFTSIAQNDLAAERRLIARYLDKNHHWRHGRLGDLRTAYGQSNLLAVEQTMLRNIVGPQAVIRGGHHDAGLTGPHLWGVDFGKRKREDYLDAGIKPVFAMNFGSHKQKFQRRENPMTHLLAQDWYTLAVGWGGRPAWWLQLMALGDTIGAVHRRTVNNGPLTGGPYRDVLDYYPTGQYLWRGPIWVNLLGDPTLRAFPLSPPQNLRAERIAQLLTLTWDAPLDPDVQGYRVYRAATPDAPFTPISQVIATQSFTDPSSPETATYMLRSYGRKAVHAGTFFTYSQGVFTAAGQTAPTPPDRQLTATPGTPLRLDLPAGGSFIEGPTQGRLTQDATGWVYTAPESASGQVFIRMAVSNAWSTTEGRVQITLAP